MVSTLTAAADEEALNQACGDDPSWICERVYDVSGNDAAAEFADWLVGGPLTALLILFAAWLLSALIKRALERWVQRVRRGEDDSGWRRWKQQLALEFEESELFDDDDDVRDEARAHSIAVALGGAAAAVIWAVAVIMALGELGVNVAPLIASAGIAGVALGFGAQSLVKDMLSGVFVLIEDQYGIGDIVDLGEAVGTVEEVNLRTTVLRGLDGTVWHVPNGEVQRVGNLSMLWSVAVVDVDVAYDSDLERARTLMTETAARVCASEDWREQVLDEPDVLGVEALGADGITLRLIVRTTPGSQWGLQRALREAFKRAFDDAGVEIPFPQRTIWMRTEQS